MREILFHGKRTDTGEWVEGFYTECSPVSNSKCVIETAWGDYAVIPETVGQYTGLTDKSGQRIFEGDIVRRGYTVKYGNGKTSDFYDNGVIEYSESNGCYIITIPGEPHFNRVTRGMVKENNIAVIGNIHDNPELLTGDKS